MRKLILLLLLCMLSCSPRQFKTPSQLTEQAREKQRKEKILKNDWKAIAIFCFSVWGIYNATKK